MNERDAPEPTSAPPDSEVRQWSLRDAIAYRTDGDAMLYQRDLDFLTSDGVWKKAGGDIDLLATIWCARDDFRTMAAAVKHYLP